VPTGTGKPCASCCAPGEELTTTSTGQINRLRALLRDGDDTDRRLARTRLTDTVLAGVARRLPAHAGRDQAVRHAEIRRLAGALRRPARLRPTATNWSRSSMTLHPG
jgi:hypothetical protein